MTSSKSGTPDSAIVGVFGNRVMRLREVTASALSLPASIRGKVAGGGPKVMSMDEIIRTALEVAGKSRFLLHQPKPLMKAIASIAQFAPGRPLTPDAIDFITMDGIADTTDLTATFNLPLTALAEGLATYLGK